MAVEWRFRKFRTHARVCLRVGYRQSVGGGVCCKNILPSCLGTFLNYVMVLEWVGTFEIAILALLGVGSVRFLDFTADF